MITIHNLSTTKKPPATSKKKSENKASLSGGEFARHVQEKRPPSEQNDDPVSSVESVAGVTATLPSTAINAQMAILQVQEAKKNDDFLQRHQKPAMVKWGNDILSSLQELRLALLSGEVAQHKLENLADVAGRYKVDMNDPLLRDILQDIQTRALVELKKIEKSSKI